MGSWLGPGVGPDRPPLLHIPDGMHWDHFTCTLYKHCLEGLNIFFHRVKLCVCVYVMLSCMHQEGGGGGGEDLSFFFS